MKTKLFITVILSCIALFASAQIIHVPADQATIQEGINAASNGDTVLVEQGTYFENINFLGKAITIASHYLVEQDSSHIYNTVINGSQPIVPDIGTVVTFDNNTDTTSCLFGFTITGGTGTKTSFPFPVNAGGGIVFTQSGGKLESNIIENNACILDTLDGFIFGGGIGSGPPLEDHLIIIKDNTIRNNVAWTKGPSSAWNMGWAEGGGIYLCYNAIVEGNLIESNICRSNDCISAGGAIRMIAVDPNAIFQILVEVRENLIRNNESISETFGAFAGGISCSAANTIIENNEITGNSVESQNYCKGAGLYFDLVNTYYAKVNNNFICNNFSANGISDGGSIGLFQSIDIEICNNLILNNSADKGGAFSVNASQPMLISNNTILNNEANEEGGAFYVYDNSEVQVYNSILRNDSAGGSPNEIYVQNGSAFSIQYSNIEGTWPGTGNIDLDPLFVDPENGNFHLTESSPCIDAGDPNSPPDPDGTICDMGKYFFHQGTLIEVPSQFATIQEGIEAATEGDTVLVAEGTYFENIRFMGKAITVASEYIMDDDSSHIVNTIIDGSQAADPDSAAVVMFVNGEDTTSILNGFTITGGSGVMLMTYVVRAGGGIFTYNAGCKIVNNIITKNHVVDNDKAGAAGIASVQTVGEYLVIVKNNYIGYNTAMAGGFTAFGGGLAIMTNCVIENNLIEYNTCTNTSSDTDGGGIELEAAYGNPTAYIKGNIIRNNELTAKANSLGAGIICVGFTPVIKDNIISNNSAFAQSNSVGGGMHIKNSPGTVEISNNTIEDNHLESQEGAFGGGIRLISISEDVIISGNIISDNTMDAGVTTWGGSISAYDMQNISISNNTIERNIGNSASGQAGGAGINLLMCSKSIIEFNTISQNALNAGTYAWGGGILIDKATGMVYINNNAINNNSSEGTGMGGGISIYNNNEDATYTIGSNEIMNNFSDSRGGGICARNAYKIFMYNNIFYENESNYFGGAIEFYESAGKLNRDDPFNPIIANNNFISNTASSGGAVCNEYDNNSPVIFNSIFMDDSASTGQDLYNAGDMDVLVYNNIIDTTVIGTPWEGDDNINEDPMFIDPENGDFHIEQNSPCAGAGIDSLQINNIWYLCPTTDFEGNPRPMPFTYMPDIGADEIDETVGFSELAVQSSVFDVRCYPNPVTSVATIHFTLPAASFAKLEIYDITGRKIKILHSGFFQAGEHSFTWDAVGLPEGMYLLRLEMGGVSENRKLLLLN